MRIHRDTKIKPQTILKASFSLIVRCTLDISVQTGWGFLVASSSRCGHIISIKFMSVTPNRYSAIHKYVIPSRALKAHTSSLTLPQRTAQTLVVVWESKGAESMTFSVTVLGKLWEGRSPSFQVDFHTAPLFHQKASYEVVLASFKVALRCVPSSRTR